MKDHCESCGCKFDNESIIRSKSYRNRCRYCVAQQTREKRAGQRKPTNTNLILGKVVKTATDELWRRCREHLEQFEKLEYTPDGTILGLKNGETYFVHIHAQIHCTHNKAKVELVKPEKL